MSASPRNISASPRSQASSPKRRPPNNHRSRSRSPSKHPGSRNGSPHNNPNQTRRSARNSSRMSNRKQTRSSRSHSAVSRDRARQAVKVVALDGSSETIQLPDGWVHRKDPYGRVFYLEKETRKSSWEVPSLVDFTDADGTTTTHTLLNSEDRHQFFMRVYDKLTAERQHDKLHSGKNAKVRIELPPMAQCHKLMTQHKVPDIDCESTLRLLLEHHQNEEEDVFSPSKRVSSSNSKHKKSTQHNHKMDDTTSCTSETSARTTDADFVKVGMQKVSEYKLKREQQLKAARLRRLERDSNTGSIWRSASQKPEVAFDVQTGTYGRRPEKSPYHISSRLSITNTTTSPLKEKLESLNQNSFDKHRRSLSPRRGVRRPPRVSSASTGYRSAASSGRTSPHVRSSRRDMNEDEDNRLDAEHTTRQHINRNSVSPRDMSVRTDVASVHTYGLQQNSPVLEQRNHRHTKRQHATGDVHGMSVLEQDNAGKSRTTSSGRQRRNRNDDYSINQEEEEEEEEETHMRRNQRLSSSSGDDAPSVYGAHNDDDDDANDDDDENNPERDAALRRALDEAAASLREIAMAGGQSVIALNSMTTMPYDTDGVDIAIPIDILQRERELLQRVNQSDDMVHALKIALAAAMKRQKKGDGSFIGTDIGVGSDQLNQVLEELAVANEETASANAARVRAEEAKTETEGLLKRLREQQSSDQATVAQSTSMLKVLDGELKDLRSRVAEVEEQKRHADTQLELDKVEYRGRLESAKEQIAALSTQLQDSEDVANQFEQLYMERNAQRRGIGEKDILSRMRREVTKCNTLRNQVIRANEQASRASNKAHVLTARNKAQAEDLAQTKQMLARAQNSVADQLAEENERLRSQVVRVRNELEESIGHMRLGRTALNDVSVIRDKLNKRVTDVERKLVESERACVNLETRCREMADEAEASSAQEKRIRLLVEEEATSKWKELRSELQLEHEGHVRRMRREAASVAASTIAHSRIERELQVENVRRQMHAELTQAREEYHRELELARRQHDKRVREMEASIDERVSDKVTLRSAQAQSEIEDAVHTERDKAEAHMSEVLVEHEKDVMVVRRQSVAKLILAKSRENRNLKLAHGLARWKDHVHVGRREEIVEVFGTAIDRLNKVTAACRLWRVIELNQMRRMNLSLQSWKERLIVERRSEEGGRWKARPNKEEQEDEKTKRWRGIVGQRSVHDDSDGVMYEQKGRTEEKPTARAGTKRERNGSIESTDNRYISGNDRHEVGFSPDVECPGDGGNGVIKNGCGSSYGDGDGDDESLLVTSSSEFEEQTQRIAHVLRENIHAVVVQFWRQGDGQAIRQEWLPRERAVRCIKSAVPTLTLSEIDFMVSQLTEENNSYTGTSDVSNAAVVSNHHSNTNITPANNNRVEFCEVIQMFLGARDGLTFYRQQWRFLQNQSYRVKQGGAVLMGFMKGRNLLSKARAFHMWVRHAGVANQQPSTHSVYSAAGIRHKTDVVKVANELTGVQHKQDVITRTDNSVSVSYHKNNNHNSNRMNGEVGVYKDADGMGHHNIDEETARENKGREDILDYGNCAGIKQSQHRRQLMEQPERKSEEYLQYRNNNNDNIIDNNNNNNNSNNNSHNVVEDMEKAMEREALHAEVHTLHKQLAESKADLWKYKRKLISQFDISQPSSPSPSRSQQLNPNPKQNNPNSHNPNSPNPKNHHSNHHHHQQQHNQLTTSRETTPRGATPRQEFAPRSSLHPADTTGDASPKVIPNRDSVFSEDVANLAIRTRMKNSIVGSKADMRGGGEREGDSLSEVTRGKGSPRSKTRSLFWRNK